MRILILILSLASLLGAQTPAANPIAAPPGNVETGKKIYTNYGCYQCHGYVGQGGAAGARIAPRPLAFPLFSKYVRQPSGQMPPYTIKMMTDQEMADIYAFLMTIPPPPDVKSIPILNN